MAGGKLGSLMAIGVFAIGACTTAGVDGTAGDDSDAFEEAEIAAMAATYRYMFANNVSGLQDGAATYCVGVGTRPVVTDPSPALLAALSDVAKVRPASTCRIGETVVNAAGQPSLLFNLATVGCDSPGNCLFEGGYYEANLSASSGRYRSREVDGEWRVAPEGPQAVS